jgi:hypothetical protein
MLGIPAAASCVDGGLRGNIDLCPTLPDHVGDTTGQTPQSLVFKRLSPREEEHF